MRENKTAIDNDPVSKFDSIMLREENLLSDLRFVRIYKEAELAELRTKTPVCPDCESGNHGCDEVTTIFKCGCECHWSEKTHQTSHGTSSRLNRTRFVAVGPAPVKEEYSRCWNFGEVNMSSKVAMYSFSTANESQ